MQKEEVGQDTETKGALSEVTFNGDPQLVPLYCKTSPGPVCWLVGTFVDPATQNRAEAQDTEFSANPWATACGEAHDPPL